MKRYFKYLILLLVFLLTGCSGNYNLVINEDMSVNEELNLTLIDSSELYSKTIQIFREANIPTENYSVTISNNNVEIVYNESYSSIEEYILNSNIYPQMFNQIQYNIKSNYIDLYIDENIKQSNSYTKLNGTNLIDFDVIQVNITNPFKVTFTNAEIINDNIYTWTIKKSDLSKKFQMQFKPSLDIFPYRQVIVGLLIILVITILSIITIRRFKQSSKF